MDLSIIIPHHGPALGLWATINACELELDGSGHEYEYVIISNGGELPHEANLLFRFLKNTGRVIHRHTDEVLTPPAARSLGVEASSGRLLFFFDNHCIPCRRYFDRAVADFAKYNMALLHSGTQFFAGDMVHYHYRLRLEERFWGESGSFGTIPVLPYRIAAGGHGGFAIQRHVWDAVEGYGPDYLYLGYGGEELNLDLKLWRMGYDNWLDPKMIHYHWAGNRPYDRHYTDEYYLNFLTSALVIGGQKWLDTVYHSFVTSSQIRLKPERHMFDLYQDALKRGSDYSRHLDSKSKHSLDEVLAKFRLEQIAYL